MSHVKIPRGPLHYYVRICADSGLRCGVYGIWLTFFVRLARDRLSETKYCLLIGAFDIDAYGLANGQKGDS